MCNPKEARKRRYRWVLTIYNGNDILPTFMPSTSELIPRVPAQEIDSLRTRLAAERETGRLKGKTAIVTGGTSGMGEATVLGFAKEGIARVYSVARHASDRLESTVAPYRDRTQLIQIEANLAGMWPDGYKPTEEERKKNPRGPNNDRGAERVIEVVRKNQGREKVDILVNNAGERGDGMIERDTFYNLAHIYAANVFGHHMIVKGLIAHNLMGPGASIIYVSSILALHGNPFSEDYTGSKAGIIGEVLSLAKSLGRFGIRVNAIAPGFVKTPFTDDLMEKAERYFPYVIPLVRPDKPRYGMPEDIAGPIVSLASDDWGWMSGSVVVVDGGMGGQGATILPMIRAKLKSVMPDQEEFLEKMNADEVLSGDHVAEIVTREELAFLQRLRKRKFPAK